MSGYEDDVLRRQAAVEAFFVIAVCLRATGAVDAKEPPAHAFALPIAPLDVEVQPPWRGALPCARHALARPAAFA
jgi:hypothetical protein